MKGCTFTRVAFFVCVWVNPLYMGIYVPVRHLWGLFVASFIMALERRLNEGRIGLVWMV